MSGQLSRPRVFGNRNLILITVSEIWVNCQNLLDDLVRINNVQRVINEN